MKIGNIEITEEDYKALAGLFLEGSKRLNVPKNKKDKIGIVIALKTEESDDRKKLETELVSELNRYLLDSGENSKFYVYSFSENLSKKINSQEDAKKLLIRSRGHLILHGNVVRRKIGGEDNYVFKLHGLVRHKPIKKIIQQQFEKEFSELLPKKIQFLMSDEGIYFELTKDWIGFVVKYITGIAAFVSGDIRLSEKLYRELDQDLKNTIYPDSISVIQVIRTRLPFRILEILSIYMASFYFTYIKSRNIEDLLKSKKLIKEIKIIDENNYGAKLQNSIICFLEGDIGSAINELSDINNNTDITWRYNLGFLYAYKGDIPNALENYKKTCRPFKWRKREVKGSQLKNNIVNLRN